MTRQSVLTASLMTALLSSGALGSTIYGLSSANELYRFDSSSPGAATLVGSISQPGIVDIDFHAANGKLYGLTSNGTAYDINVSTGAATFLFSPSLSLSGVADFDFNPMADRLRVSATGNANYRLVPDFITAPSPAGTAGAVVEDGTFLVPTGVTILSNAYTNAFDSPASTELYSIGSDGVLYLHTNGPQFNTMTAVGAGLGITPAGAVGFDISGLDNAAYLSHGSDFYSVNLAAGTASLMGTSNAALVSIAAAPIPEPSAAALGAAAILGALRRRRTKA